MPRKTPSMPSSTDPAHAPSPRLAVSVAVWRDGQVLLVKRGRPPLAGLWSLPGGHVHPGERLAVAAAREVREETSLLVAPQGPVETNEVISRDADGHIEHHYVILVFAAHWQGGEARAGDDAADVRWADPHALNGIELTRGTAPIILRSAESLQIKLG